ncbi:hypothetical protein [Paraburkholderia youngii]|uniref:hypothetical protein n=1 Tax=Paraburkholderia youngii TaxID=2782701 RepID=UPI0020D17E76|nr:hypothetical protein [Paraburkholderia youngii]
MTTDTSTTAGPLIEIQREYEVALVKLNRADKRNAINDALLAELTLYVGNLIWPASHLALALRTVRS